MKDSISAHLEKICEEVRILADETGDFILREARGFERSKVETKSKNSLVSYVDKMAEAKLVAGLSDLIPASGFVAEEGTSDKKGAVWNWVIDPLDGTTNFIHGIPCFAISIALMRHNEPVLGLVKELNQNESFYAWEHSKAYLNGEVIEVNPTSAISDSLVATGFPYFDYDRLQPYLQFLQDMMHQSRGVRRIGSAATDLVYVACGRFDCFFEYGLHPWDVAAGGFILQQAGGKVSDFNGGTSWLFGKEILATTDSLFEAFSQKIKHYFR